MSKEIVMPMQPIKDHRFVPNRMVNMLLDKSDLTMNDLQANEDFTNQERMQFIQLTGCSLGYFGDADYVDDISYKAAEKYGDYIEIDKDKQMTDKQIHTYEVKDSTGSTYYIKAYEYDLSVAGCYAKFFIEEEREWIFFNIVHFKEVDNDTNAIDRVWAGKVTMLKRRREKHYDEHGNQDIKPEDDLEITTGKEDRYVLTSDDIDGIFESNKEEMEQLLNLLNKTIMQSSEIRFSIRKRNSDELKDQEKQYVVSSSDVSYSRPLSKEDAEKLQRKLIDWYPDSNKTYFIEPYNE